MLAGKNEQPADRDLPTGRRALVSHYLRLIISSMKEHRPINHQGAQVNRLTLG